MGAKPTQKIAMNTKSIVAICGLSLCFGLAGAGVFHIINEKRSALQIVEARDYPPVRAVGGAGLSSVDFTIASEIGAPSVVFIKTISGSQRQADDYWSLWDFWGRRGPISSAGSGVIVSADGYIVTNNHVIDGADKIEVVLNNKHTFSAKIVGTDPNTDLALIKINGKNLKPAIFSNSDKVRIGEWALAIGNPLNLTSTVTAGIISAKGRNINIVNSQFPIESFIQTDAAINPGNSGGALVNVRGELIGVNTAIASKTGAYSGYGFAIPSNIAKKVIQDLMDHGEVQRAFMGVEVADVSEEIADKLPDDDFTGVYAYNVAADGAGAAAGVHEGDVIVKIDGVDVNSKAEFLERLSYYRPGDKIKVMLKRNKTLQEVTVTVVNRDGNTELLRNTTVFSNALGCSVTPLSKVEKQRLGVNSGLRLSGIRGGRIRNMNLPEDFVILSINGKTPKNADELSALIENVRGRLIIEGAHSNGQRGTYSFFSY